MCLVTVDSETGRKHFKVILMKTLRCDICNTILTNKNIGYIKVDKEKIFKCRKCHVSVKSQKKHGIKIF